MYCQQPKKKVQYSLYFFDFVSVLTDFLLLLSPFFGGKLHFTTLNYTLNYTLRPKLFRCTFCTLNYDICYACTLYLNFLLYWTESSITWLAHDYCLSNSKSKDLNALFQVKTQKTLLTSFTQSGLKQSLSLMTWCFRPLACTDRWRWKVLWWLGCGW